MAELSQMPSVAVGPPRQDGILPFQWDAQTEGLSCLGEEVVALDGKIDKGSSALQVLTVNEQALSVLGPSDSLASVRTASTELYVPHHSKAESPQNGCVSNFRNDLRNERQTSPVQKVEDFTRDKPRRLESSKRSHKKRKRSQTELAIVDVEAAIATVVRAAEAIVVGHVLGVSNLSFGQGRSVVVEAALSLGKARQLCGLDKYDLSATTEDSGDLALQDLDDKTMQEAYDDVGMIVDVPEDKRQFLDAGTEVVNLYQRKTEVHPTAVCTRSSPSDTSDPLHSNRHTASEAPKEPAQNHKSVECSRNSEVEDGSIVAQPTEFGSHLEIIQVCQGHERTGDFAQVQSLGMQEVKETAAIFQLAEGVSTIEISVPSKVYGPVLDKEVKEPSPSYKSMAVVSSDPEVEIAEGVAGNQEFNIRDCHQETEVLQEMDLAVIDSKPVGVFSTEVIQCQRDAESPVFLALTCHRSEGQQVVGEAVPKCKAVPSETIRSMEAFCDGLEDKPEETVAQVSKADMVIKDKSTNSDMFCGDFLLRSDSVVGAIQNEAEHQEEVQAEAAITVEVGVAENKAAQSFESREPHAEFSLPPTAMASSETKRSNPDVGRNPVILKDPSLDNATTNLVTRYVSRWFGGWSGNAEFNPSPALTAKGNADVVRLSPTRLNDIGSEDAVPERNAFLARQKRTPCGQETLISVRVSVDEADVHCLPQYDEAISEEPQSDHSNFQALHLSQIDPLCSFVPCSISPPAALSLLPCRRDHQSSILAATVEACARAAMNVIDSRKVTNCQQAGQAAELERPDPTVRTHNETSGQQIPEGRRDSVSPPVTKDASVKWRPTLMKKLSTTTNSLSLLLHAVDVAEDCIPEGDDLKRPSTRSPNLIPRSPLLDCDHPEGMQAEVEQSADRTQSTTDMLDVTPNASGRRMPKKRRMHSPDIWMCANLSDSPPLLWPRGTKRRLTACRVIDSDSTEWLHHDADEQHIAQKNLNDKEEHTLQGVTQQSGVRILRTSIRSSKPCHDPKTLFNGLQFLLTGFSSQKKEKLSKSIEQHGGVLLANVPAFSPKQRFKRRGVDCGARSLPIVIAPQQMRTHKYLYGCAVGAPLLNASWISASVSAVKCLDYYQYQHRQKKAGCVLQTDNGFVSKSSERPLFVGFQFLFHGQQDSISQLSTLAKHAGGKVIRKLVLNESEQKQGQKLVGVVVVEGSSNLPLELQRAASKLEWQLVDAEWVVVSLLSGKLVPFSTKCTPPSSVLPTQESSASKTGEPLLQRYSRRRIRLQSENIESRGEGDSRIELLVKKVKDRSPPDENHRPSSSLKPKRGGKELDDNQGHVNNTCCWLGKGFTSPPQVPQMTDRVLGPYSHSLAHKKLPKKFLYYKAVLCNGLEYSLGDIVEVRSSTADAPPSVARIEGLWSEEGGRLPQTQAFQQGVRKKAFKIVVLKCRRFFRPSDTGFPGQQGGNTSNELYLSNDIDNNVSASDIVRRVRVKLETAGEVVHCDNWYDDDAADGQERAGPLLSACHKKRTKAASNVADYFCSFFYDHVRESLHRIKLNV